MGYLKDAKKYFKIAPYDWINSILKFSSKPIKEDNGKKSTKPKIRALLNKTT